MDFFTKPARIQSFRGAQELLSSIRRLGCGCSAPSPAWYKAFANCWPKAEPLKGTASCSATQAELS